MTGRISYFILKPVYDQEESKGEAIEVEQSKSSNRNKLLGECCIRKNNNNIKPTDTVENLDIKSIERYNLDDSLAEKIKKLKNTSKIISDKNNSIINNEKKIEKSIENIDDLISLDKSVEQENEKKNENKDIEKNINEIKKKEKNNKENNEKENKNIEVKVHTHRALKISLIILGIIMVIAVGSITVFSVINNKDKNIKQGVSIEGIDVSGLSKEAAKQKVQTEFFQQMVS